MARSPDLLSRGMVSMADGPQAVSALRRFELDGAFDEALAAVADALDRAAFDVAGIELGNDPHDRSHSGTGNGVLLVVARKRLSRAIARGTPAERVLPIVALVYEEAGGSVRMLLGPQPLYERVCPGSSGEISQRDEDDIARLIEALETVSRPS